MSAERNFALPIQENLNDDRFPTHGGHKGVAQHFSSPERKNCHLRIMYSVKISFRKNGEIMVFSNEEKQQHLVIPTFSYHSKLPIPARASDHFGSSIYNCYSDIDMLFLKGIILYFIRFLMISVSTICFHKVAELFAPS